MIRLSFTNTTRMALHVYGFLHAGTEKFRREVTQKLTEAFKMGKTQQRKFELE